MSEKPIAVACVCGKQITICELIYTWDYQLILFGFCAACRHMIRYESSVEQLIVRCEALQKPGGPLRPPMKFLPAPTYTKEDISLLADMNISLGEKDE